MTQLPTDQFTRSAATDETEVTPTERHASDSLTGAESSPPHTDDDPTSPGSLKDRFFRPQTLLSFALAAGVVIFFIQRLEINPREVWANARQADPARYTLAFVIFYAGFFLRAWRWRGMLRQAGISPERGYPVPRTLGLVEIYLLSWFANCIVPAKLGDAYRGYLLKQSTRASFSTGLGTILSERLIDLVSLFVAMTGSALLVFHGHLPGEATQTVIIGSVMLTIGILGLVGMWLSRNLLQQRLPERFREQYARLHEAVFASLRRPERFLAISLLVWLTEGLRLFLVARALGVELPISTAIFVALLGSLLTALPVTPAGLGFVEGGMIVALSLVGVEGAMAASITIMDRVIGYWSIIVVGLILYAWRIRRTIATPVPAPSKTVTEGR